MGEVGSARPIKTVHFDGDGFEFSLPKQYEGRETDLVFRGSFAGDAISGHCLADDGTWIEFEGTRAPELPANPQPVFGDPIELVGSDMSNWVVKTPDWVNHWKATEGGLANGDVGSDIVSVQKFTDFRLVAEYSYPKGSNSGIYLRGRYEMQVLDDYGEVPHVGSSAGIYGFLVPSESAIKPAGERNVAEITLLGRWVTIVLNGVTVIDNKEIPGITGGALESNEGEPGAFLIQGDHGPVTYHKLTVYPVIG